MHGYRSIEKTSNGKHTFVINPRNANTAYPMTVPCGYCIGCRLERSRQWAMRCLHESKLHDKNCFLTLTINPKNMNQRGHESLDKRDIQLFMKKLKSHVRRNEGKKAARNIRFYHCGEYGPSKGRAHYHVLLFGYDFKDKKFWKHSKPNKFISITSKFPLYRSAELEKIWKMGFSSIGEVTFETAAYVSRYLLKKQYGKNALEHYNEINYETGEITKEWQPEYTTMSRRPGIGKGWLDKYLDDVYPKDFVTVKGRSMRPPRYYDKIIESTNPKMFQKIKGRRKRKALKAQIEDRKKPLNERAPCLQMQERARTLNQKNQTRSYEDENT